VTLGHETVGEVVSTGPDAVGVQAGERRLIYPWNGCGGCPSCRRGDEHLCPTPRYLGIFRPGGYASHIVVPHPRYLFEIGSIPPAEAAPYACSGLTTYTALKRVGIETLREQQIVIVGAGGLGLMCVGLLRALGGAGAVVVDVSEGSRAAAQAAGALATIDGSAPDALQQALAAAGGPVPAVIDFVGAPATARLGLDCLAKGGQLILVGLFGGELPVALPLLPLRAISITGSFVGGLREMGELLSLVRESRVPPIPICECGLDEANDALVALKLGRRVGRTVLRPDRALSCEPA